MTLFIICIVLSALCFTVVFLMNKGEKTYVDGKNEMVDKFMKAHEITSNKRFSGYNFDLIHGLENECVWYLIRDDNELIHKKSTIKIFFKSNISRMTKQ